jgi:hypothetical protein
VQPYLEESLKPTLRCKVEPQRLTRMFLGYIDDSGSTGANVEDCESRFQVIGGPLINCDCSRWWDLETYLSDFIKEAIPEELWGTFEFHACDLFHSDPPYDKPHIDGKRVMQRALEVIRDSNFPIVYGAVDKQALRREIYSSANPVDIAFRLYF